MHDILNFAVNKRFMITAAHISQFSSRFSPTLFFYPFAMAKLHKS